MNMTMQYEINRKGNEMKRMIVKATCSGFGSAMRSALCPIESGYISFTINGVRYLAFCGKRFTENMFCRGREYDISFIPDAANPKVLKYPKLIN
jgi:hypothetical protein